MELYTEYDLDKELTQAFPIVVLDSQVSGLLLNMYTEKRIPRNCQIYVVGTCGNICFADIFVIKIISLF